MSLRRRRVHHDTDPRQHILAADAGQLNLTVTPDTGSSDGRVNRPDPRVRLPTASARLPSPFPAGATKYSMAVSSTGTVASSVVTSVQHEGWIVGGSGGTRFQGIQDSTGVPVITSGCYSSGNRHGQRGDYRLHHHPPVEHGELHVRHRQRRPAKSVDISSSAAGYFSTDDSVRNGGAFTLTVPFTLENTSVSNLSVTLSNSEGSFSVSQPQSLPVTHHGGLGESSAPSPLFLPFLASAIQMFGQQPCRRLVDKPDHPPPLPGDQLRRIA